MTEQELKNLIDKYADGTCTEQELILLELWFDKQQSPHNSLLTTEKKQQLWFTIQERQHDKTYKSRKLAIRRWIPYAAALLLLGFTAAMLITQHNNWQENRIAKTPIEPGKDRALLTSSGGQKIDLNMIQNELITADGLKIIRNAAGQLTIVATANDQSAGKINMIQTPRGGQFNILLSDGTQVSLNAASTLSFPSDLNKGLERKVTLTGEAYFSVSKNPKRPFIVQSKNQRIHVYGTEFNVNTYNSKDITTLLEGKVSVNNLLLKPGDQSTIENGTAQIHQVNVENYIDWKNNKFIFDNERLVSIMERISRWYDIGVTYKNEDAQKVSFTGEISRYSKIDEVLDMLRKTSTLKFELHERLITVK